MNRLEITAELLQSVVEIAHRAGEAILRIYEAGFSVEMKPDNSPVTEADKAADAVIRDGLRLLGDIPYISEESPVPDYSVRKDYERFWVVDPLDGTKEFVKRNGEFTVNIALIENHLPVLGVVYAPVQNLTYYGGKNLGAWKQSPEGEFRFYGESEVSESEKTILVVSRSHSSPETLAYIEKIRSESKVVELVSSGSSIKLCLVAEGKAHYYPRMSPAMEWDTAAAHAIALENGYDIFVYGEGKPLRYNKESLLNPWFIAGKKYR